MDIQCPKCYTINPEDTHFCSKCGSSLENIQATLSYGEPEAIQEVFVQFKAGDYFDNRYRIIEEIGRGGMGSVYKAEDTKLNITVALKLIRPKLAANPIFLDRFKKETLTARSISHENVVRIYDLGEVDETKYISMEYIKGQSLRDLILASGYLTIETAVNITKQICAGLKAAHKKSIIHRDLKPSNIMMDMTGQAYVMDFGLARSVHISETDQTEHIAGTPPHMSPEQILGEKLDLRSDIYSLGIVMYEMLTGKRPFQGNTSSDYFRLHIEEDVKPPSRLNPRIPPRLEAVILKCLAKDREQRYANVDQILADLAQISQSDQKSLVNWLRNRWYLVLSALVLLTLAVAYFWLNRSPQALVEKGEKISLAVMYLSNETGDKDLDWMGRSICELLIADLMQSQRIRVITGDRLYDILKTLDLLDSTKYSSQDLRQVAAKAGAKAMLQGSITKFGDVYRVNTSLHKADTLEPIGTQQMEGKGEEQLFPLVDGLTRQIKEDLQFPARVISQDIDKDVINITTNNPQALNYYIQGKLLYNDRKFKESIKALEKAIDMDPDFAVAHVKIADNYFYLMNDAKSDEHLAKALSLLDKVSDREFYLIQAFASDTPQQKIENYKKLLELYPDDLEGNGYLASLYRNLEEWDLAQEHFERIIKIDPYDELTLENLAHINKAKGHYGNARGILESQQEIFPNPVHFHWSMGLAYFCEGKPEPAMAEVIKAQNIEPENILICELKGHIHQIQGDYTAAENCYRKMINEGDAVSQSLGRLWLCHMYLMRHDEESMIQALRQELEQSQQSNFMSGQFNMRLLETYYYLQRHQPDQAWVASTQALKIALDIPYPDYKNFALHFQGLAHIHQGKLEQAKETAEMLKQQVEESFYMKNMRHYHHLMGEVYRAENNIPQAIACFEKAASLLPAQYFQHDPHLFFLDSLATAYYENQDWEKAEKEFEKITSLTTGRLRWGDKYVLSYYYLGRISQILEEPQKAAGYYQKFLSIWSTIAPNPKEVRDAKNQLAVLGIDN